MIIINNQFHLRKAHDSRTQQNAGLQGGRFFWYCTLCAGTLDRFSWPLVSKQKLIIDQRRLFFINNNVRATIVGKSV